MCRHIKQQEEKERRNQWIKAAQIDERRNQESQRIPEWDRMQADSYMNKEFDIDFIAYVMMRCDAGMSYEEAREAAIKEQAEYNQLIKEER